MQSKQSQQLQRSTFLEQRNTSITVLLESLNNGSKDIHILAWTSYVTLHGKRDFPNVIKLMILRLGDDHDYAGGLNIIIRVLLRNTRDQ